MTVTAELNISFKAPVRVGETLYIEATPTRESRKLILVHATIHNAEGELKATADAKMMVLSKDQLEELGLSENILNEVSTPRKANKCAGDTLHPFLLAKLFNLFSCRHNGETSGASGNISSSPIGKPHGMF
ncbi:PaaI family thioesterase [Alicyclobacillus sp. TC]|uniref:PaaI family thioesterase n=1 Tax=Alicyclobacillus sp. TC TaxID=2606450 RepID=UPI001EE44177|nr:hotdog fold domain-containing protein [Alicyclobacillus sp. TC]